MKKTVLRISGMSCSACSGGLEKYLNKQKGVNAASVNLVMASAAVEYDEQLIGVPDIERFIAEAGFESVGEYSKTQDKSEKNQKSVFIVFTVLAVLVMYVSMGHMIGIPLPPFLDLHDHPVVFCIVSLALCIPFLVYGWDIISSGVKNVLHKTPNMDTLVTLGVVSALVYSVASTVFVIKGNNGYIHELYYETVAIVIYFVKLGRFIDKSSKSKTRKAISSLVQITPSFAYIKKGDGVSEIPIDEIKVGDILICRPGDKIAVDGKIISGESHVDESFVTGESKPALKKEGDNVLAGALNTSGYIEYVAQRVGKDSTVSEIVRLVVEASSTKAPIAKIADTVCLFFVPAVCIVALLSFTIQIGVGLGISSAVSSLITVLVVACPCALGLATPLAVVISEGSLAQDGILVKKSEILENASKINTVVFDKTGTLTYGTMKISQKFIYTDKILENELLSRVAAIEKKSSHPIAKAFSEFENNLHTVTDFEVIEGFGLHANVNGAEYFLVNGAYIDKLGIQNSHKNDEFALASDGNSIVYALSDGEILALFGIRDIVRKGIKEQIQTLKDMKIRCVMLTGDNEKTATKIARDIGIDDVIADVMPKQKADIIKSLKENGAFCAMAGDGINDSVALSCADIGISMHGATDIAMDCSDVIMTHFSPDGIAKLINTGKRTLKVIKQNLFFAFIYNSLMIPIAAGALIAVNIKINPMIASLAMVLSSLCVSLNSLRLSKKIK